MKRNCNLELRLSYPQDNLQVQQNSMLEDDPPNNNHLSIATCADAAQLQARAIIWFETQKMEDEESEQHPLSPLLVSLGYSPTSVLPLKRSLRRFLQKRKSRSQSTTPYTIPKKPT